MRRGRVIVTGQNRTQASRFRFPVSHESVLAAPAGSPPIAQTLRHSCRVPWRFGFQIVKVTELPLSGRMVHKADNTHPVLRTKPGQFFNIVSEQVSAHRCKNG